MSTKNCSRSVGLIAKTVSLLPRGRGSIPRLIGKLFRSSFLDCYVTTRHGAKVIISPSALDLFTTMACNDWAVDYWVLDTCADLLPDNGAFYDIGANVGYMSLEMTRLKPSLRHIVSFEPQSDLVRSLLQSCDLNGIENLTIFQACVGDISGNVSFRRERHSVHAHVEYSAVDRGSDANEQVRQVALDDLVGEGEIPSPDVIKIDVEGYEYSVLQGARSVISAHNPHIVFELSDANLKFGHSPKDYFNLLSSLGRYRYEIAVGSYREAVCIEEIEEFDKKFVSRPYLTNILARAQGRGGGQQTER